MPAVVRLLTHNSRPLTPLSASNNHNSSSPDVTAVNPRCRPGLESPTPGLMSNSNSAESELPPPAHNSHPVRPLLPEVIISDLAVDHPNCEHIFEYPFVRPGLKSEARP